MRRRDAHKRVVYSRVPQRPVQRVAHSGVTRGLKTSTLQKTVTNKNVSYHISRFRFFWKYIFLIFMIAAGFIAYVLGYSYSVYLALMTAPFLGFLFLEVRVRSERIIISDDVLRIETGLFSKNITTLTYNNVAGIHVYQSILQRILRYGNIEFVVPGSILQQKIQQHFAGKGNVILESPGGRPRGIFLKKFQQVRKIESIILSKTREKAHAMH